MASFDPIDQFPFDSDAAPPRPTTPPVRRGFLMVLAVLSALTILVYGIPHLADRIGYAWESGRARAASEALAKLDKRGVINMASALFREATVKVSPSVVNIRSVNFGAARAPGLARGAGDGGGVRPRGFQQPGPRGQPEMGPTLYESGSGFIIDKDRGFVVTNYHVVKDADELYVYLWTGGELPAKLVGADSKTDLAVLQVQAGGLQIAAEWGDSDKIDVGDWVLALGSPLQLDRTVTQGIVSATGRSGVMPGEGSYEDFIQTDAALNPGNSGGPLIDLRGQVIGVNTAIVSRSGGNQGIGMAISANLAKRVVADLIKSGRVIRGYLGVALDRVTPEKARELKLPEPRGALILHVEPESPAAHAGLLPNDVVIQIGGKPVADYAAMRLLTAGLAAGSKVSVTVIRDGKRTTLSATIGELPALLTLGVRLRDLPAAFARQLPNSPDKAVIVEHVDPGSPAAASGLRPGIRVLAVGETPISTKADCDAAVAKLDPSAGIPLRLQALEGRAAGRSFSFELGGPHPGIKRE